LCSHRAPNKNGALKEIEGTKGLRRQFVVDSDLPLAILTLHLFSSPFMKNLLDRLASKVRPIGKFIYY
jgi:hypothetical protein